MSSALNRSCPSLTRSISPPQSRRKIPAAAAENAPSQDEVRKDCPAANLKIMSWNVNGVRPLLQKQISFDKSPGIYPLRAFLRKHEWPDMLCLQEVKINRTDSATQRHLRQAANEGACPGEPYYDIEFSLPRDKFNATGFGGKVHGVASLYRQDTLAQLTTTRKPEWDLEGRIMFHETSHGLIIVNGYWVNGSTAPYRNPVSGELDGDRHGLKLRYHDLILNEVLIHQREGKSVILIGDMNVARQTLDGFPNPRTSPEQHVKNRYDFNQKFILNETGMRGVDVFRQFHGDRKKYTYWPRNRPWGLSMDRVDLIVCSRQLVHGVDAVKDTDICDNEVDRGHSDHVPLWIVIDVGKFGKEAAQNSQIHSFSANALQA